MFYFVVINGLKPEIRNHVTRTQPTTWSELVHHAKIGEMCLPVAPPIDPTLAVKLEAIQDHTIDQRIVASRSTAMPIADNARNVDLVLPNPDAGNGMPTLTASLRARADHVGLEGAGSPGNRAHRIFTPKLRSTELQPATELWPNAKLWPGSKLWTSKLCTTADAYEPTSLYPATSQHGDWMERWTRDADNNAVWQMWMCPTPTPKHFPGRE